MEGYKLTAASATKTQPSCAFVLTGLLEGYFFEFRWQMLNMFLSQGFHVQKLQLFGPPIFWLTCGFVLDFMKPEIKINFKNTGMFF